MTINKVYLIIGGDLRQCHLANLTSKRNRVYVLGFGDVCLEEHHKNIIPINKVSQINEAIDFVIFPLPTLIDDKKVFAPLYNGDLLIDDILENVVVKNGIFGGKLEKSFYQKFYHLNIPIIDYLQREELAILNAVPTAEGAISIMMNELATTVFGTNCLITGFGRISKVLVKSLVGLGVDVTVCARKYSDLAWAKVYGCNAIHISSIANNIEDYDVVINTVPAMILDNSILCKLSEDCLVIDLASKPGGVDFETAKQLGIKTIWALSLPGKVAPITSGEIISDTIQNIISEMG
jgi:dipicolinate synthase subunit A